MRRKLVSAGFAIWLGLFPIISTANAQEPVDAAMNAKIREEGLKRSRALRDLHYFTEVIGPRLNRNAWRTRPQRSMAR